MTSSNMQRPRLTTTFIGLRTRQELKSITSLFAGFKHCNTEKLHPASRPTSSRFPCSRSTSPKTISSPEGKREKEVAFLCEHVRNARKNGQRGICTIHSIGGVGKTQLALEYAHRFRAEFECDGSTMTYDELLGVDLVRRDYVGSTMYAKYKPGYRWY